MWLLRPGSLEETLSPLPTRKDFLRCLKSVSPSTLFETPSVLQVRMLVVPESHPPFPSDRTLHVGADVVPQTQSQSRIGCSSQRCFPREWSFCQVQTESGGAPLSAIWNTLVQYHFSSSSGSLSAVMSAWCCSLQHRTSSESSCIQFLTISDPSAQVSLAFGCVSGDNFSRAPRSSRSSQELVHHALCRLQAHTSLGPHRVSDGYTLVFSTSAEGRGAVLHLYSCPFGKGAISSVVHLPFFLFRQWRFRPGSLYALPRGSTAIAAAQTLSAHVKPAPGVSPPIPNLNEKLVGPKTLW